MSPCIAMSFGVSTRVISSSPRPVKATAVTLSFSASAKIQPVTMSTNATAVIRSSRESGPSTASSLRAATGASGVLPTPGGNRYATTRGSSRIAVSAGTDATRSHFPKLIGTPNSFATWMPIGLAEVAVIQRAEETARPAIVQNIR